MKLMHVFIEVVDHNLSVGGTCPVQYTCIGEHNLFILLLHKTQVGFYIKYMQK